MELQTKLEEFKRRHYYGVTFWYGETVGCDDGDVKIEERRVRLLAHPVGCLGETKVHWRGTLKEFLDFDFTTQPTLLPNPPSDEDMRIMDQGGWHIWGTESGVETIRKNWSKRQGEVLP